MSYLAKGPEVLDHKVSSCQFVCVRSQSGIRHTLVREVANSVLLSFPVDGIRSPEVSARDRAVPVYGEKYYIRSIPLIWSIQQPQMKYQKCS